MEHHHPNPKRKVEWIKYIVTFLVTAGLFVSAFYVSRVIAEKRVAEIRSIQDSISLDLLSSETQFSLLNDSDCSQDGTSILAPELGQMGDRLSGMETDLGLDNPDVIQLKKYYSLLEIKDYMLAREYAKNCNVKPVTVIYFYKNDCDDCTKQGYALTALREKYPTLRVYSFDADLNLSAIATLQTITKVSGKVPTLVIGTHAYTGFQSIDDIEKIPEIKKLKDKMIKDEASAKAKSDSSEKTVSEETHQ
ncbi:MAG: hypothetical protein JWM20_90 [Patescibacteria group bacterium]|nr:hypothetical protein [Patescibacteria group bacterium]